MTDTMTAADAARIAAETEASREIAAEAATDNPNPTNEPAATPTPGPSPQGGGEARDAEAEPKPLERITGFDRGRAEIAARFKEKRAAHGGQVEFHGDMRDPSQTYGPYAPSAQMSDDGAQRTEEPGHPAHQQSTGEEAHTVQAPPSSDLRHPSPDSRLVKVKVHGREAWLPEDQVIAEAQKSLAAGNLLESAKEVLSGARGQMSDVRDRMSESGDPTFDLRHPTSDPYVALAHTLQLEGPEAAGSKLRQAIESETARARAEAARHVRVENELAVSQRAMQAFEATHPELAADEFARDALTTQVHREINADIKAAVDQGILTEVPKTQDERNALHTQLRAFAAPVARPIGNIFDAAGTKYATWRGGEKPTPRPAPPPNSQVGNRNAENPASAAAAPRVELSPDRAQRRAHIPAQPTNGTVPPRPAPPPEQTTAGRRSAAIMAMRKARGQIVA
jgi:hypothetical protein